MELVKKLLAGDRRALAHTISLVEDDGPEAHAALAALYPHTGRAHVIGITGAPGTGKSTLVNALARLYRRRQLTVGIVAVDPTSPFSGGALLGDRIRMRDLAGDAGVFIRSMATRGSLGGLAQATGDVILVLDAAGFQRVLVETVGVGQAEVEIASSAHTVVVVTAPGLGDEVQAIKAGVMEIADIFAVNKADREGAEHTVMAIQMMQGLAPQAMVPGSRADDGWEPPILKTVATRGQGVAELLEAIEAHAAYLHESHLFERRERARVLGELEAILQAELLARLRARLPEERLETLVEQVLARRLDPYTAVAQLLESGGSL
ncbi:MAG: methylmalonyl Co-A mutase-associated GTPase MeaB [Anaerolineae bacterium]|nr:methylmalonyl Co-A mutase-associated GTPase MeaB [Anaerolineae bacterium]